MGTALARCSTMSNVIIVYDTKYGQTQRIAEYISDVVQARGHHAEVVRVGAADALDGAHCVVVLAPVFVGKHMSTVRRFVMHHHKALNRRASAFFSVCGAAESTIPTERASAQQIASDFVASTPWRPQVVTAVGGAMDYPRYNPFLRFVLKFIAKRNGGPTDTSRRHELTNWKTVERITLELLTSLEPTRAVATSAEAPVGVQP